MDNEIDLTENNIFCNNNVIKSSELFCNTNDSIIESSKIFTYNILDIVSRDDCKNYFDYLYIVNNILKIKDPDKGFEVYSLGLFCDTCEKNLFFTKERIECKECFNKRNRSII